MKKKRRFRNISFMLCFVLLFSGIPVVPSFAAPAEGGLTILERNESVNEISMAIGEPETASVSQEEMQADSEGDGIEIQSFTIEKTGTLPQTLLTASAGVDLFASNMRAAPGSPAEPFENNTSVTIQCDLAVIGTEDVGGCVFSFYADGALRSRYQVAAMEANTTYTISLNVTGNCGEHTIAFWFNEDQFVEETNYSNNVASRVFAWEDEPSIRAVSFQKTDNLTTFECNQDMDFELAIANIGSMDATEIPLEIYEIDLNKNTETRFVTATFTGLPKGMQATIPLSFHIGKACDIRIEVRVGTPPEGDAISYDNEVSTPELHITYDTELWAGAWEDPNLDVMVEEEIVNYLNEYNYSQNQLKTIIEEWNSVSSQASFTTYFVQDTLLIPEEMEQNVYLILEENQFPSILGLTTMYRWTNNNEMLQIPDDDIESMKCNYYSSIVILYSKVLNSSPEDYRMDTILHEFGHVLGLKHVTCANESIMLPNMDDVNFPSAITGHDRYNVIRKYGE